MNEKLKKCLLAEFEPGSRHYDGFYTPSKIGKFNRCMDSNDGYFAYIWDEKQGKHVRRWIEKNSESDE